MKEVKITACNHTNTDNDNFVGIKFIPAKGEDRGEVKVFFPLGYNYTKNNDAENEDRGTESRSQLKQEIFSLLTTIKHYNKATPSTKLFGTSDAAADFPFDAYLTIIKDFMQNGYYIENETRFKQAAMGKINWRRTIHKIKPLFQNGSPVYTDFIIKEKAIEKEKIITLIHEWCVYDAFIKFGWLFTQAIPHKPTIDIQERNKEHYITIVRKALSNTYNDRYKQLFTAILSILESLRDKKENVFYYGTTNFQMVFEKLIDTAFGIPECEKEEYFPRANWELFTGLSYSSSLQPDTIMKIEEENIIFVLDAKYYKYEVDKSLPGAADISKQIVYGEHAYNVENEDVYNAFIIPYNFKKDNYGILKLENKKIIKLKNKDGEYYVCCIGYAEIKAENNQCNDKETYGKVLAILMDTKTLIDNVYNLEKVKLGEHIKDSYGKYVLKQL